MEDLVTRYRVKQFSNQQRDYFMHNCNFTFDKSALCTNPACVKLRLRFVAFFVKMWLLKACLRLIFPLPVMVNLFFALDFVFILGITTFFKS